MGTKARACAGAHALGAATTQDAVPAAFNAERRAPERKRKHGARDLRCIRVRYEALKPARMPMSVWPGASRGIPPLPMQPLTIG